MNRENDPIFKTFPNWNRTNDTICIMTNFFTYLIGSKDQLILVFGDFGYFVRMYPVVVYVVPRPTHDSSQSHLILHARREFLENLNFH